MMLEPGERLRPRAARPGERRRERLRRRIHLLPHLFTMGNLFAGYFSISELLQGEYDHAAIAIGIGIVLDGLDGAVARLVRTTSPIGVQLDSLADVVTFGIAPGLLAFAWGVGALDVAGAESAIHIRRLGWIAAFAFVAACALRLARFNVMTHDDADALPPVPRHDFTGMPTPTAAACIAVAVHVVKRPLVEPVFGAVAVAGVFVVAGLMVSRIPFFNVKHFLTSDRSPHLVMLVMALLLAAVYYYSEIVLLSLLLVYLSWVVIRNGRRRRQAAKAD